MNTKRLKDLVDKLEKAQDKLGAQQQVVEGIRHEIEQEIGSSAPAKAPKARPAKTGGRAPRGSVSAAINQAVDAGKEFTAGDIVKALASSGASVAKGSINAGIGKLKKEKKIKLVKRGVYVKA